ncbi:MAG: hypothetical protein GY835_22125 [bacterium]|nr:hypothetical protein [bacterium]
MRGSFLESTSGSFLGSGEASPTPKPSSPPPSATCAHDSSRTSTTTPSNPPREADATFVLDLADGVMIHSAALWPLLESQGWKKPRQWWSELCCAKGKKDYDWAHLARRYFPARVEARCAEDPSLAVAHGCFWRLHPAKAYEWERRLQDEIGPDFTLDEEDSDTRRATFLEEHPDQAAAVRAAEAKRRERKRKKQERAAAEEAARRRGPGIHGPLLRS